MRYLILLSLLFAISCGKDGDKKTVRQNMESIDLMWDGDGVEFKEAVVSVNAVVNNGSIVIAENASDVDQGNTIKCALNVTKDESMQFSVKGNRLYLQTNAGNYDMVKVNTLNGYLGTYSSVIRTSGGERIELLLTLQPSHIVLRKKCEG